MGYERKNIKAMKGYVSGEQPESPEVIKLNTNENPFPPSSAVFQILKDMQAGDLRRYPPPTAAALRKSIAELHGVDSDNVIVTNGGDELLRLAMTTFVDNSEHVAVAEPTYTLYQVLAAAQGCGFIRFALNEDWTLPAGFVTKLNEANVKMCLLPNPHAPSGTLIPANVIHELAQEFNGVLLLDEAYADFVDPDQDYDCVSLIRELDNLLILRTFSKGYSLAGLRMAYGLGARSLIDPMQYKTKDSYNTDYIAQKLARAAIEDQEYASGTWESVREQRRTLHKALSELGFMPMPSQSNFILATVPAGTEAREIYEALKARDILVRYFDQDRLRDKLRISIGTITENQQLMAALKQIVNPKNI